MKKVHVILSGGIGTRLWPLSSKLQPKQYIPIFGKNTLFQLAALKNKDFCDALLVVGNNLNSHLSIENLNQIGISEFGHLIESEGRNTAAAVAFAAFNLDSDDILLISPSDHIIEDETNYAKAIKRAFELAEQDNLVTFGIQPNKPETGYGYIRHDGEDVLSFHEKPDAEKAKSFLESRNFLWNSGIFCFKAGIYLKELEKFRPDIYSTCKIAYELAEDGKLPLEESRNIPSESIDYAVMEKSDRIKVVECNFSWSDLGSFESLFNYFNTTDSNDFIKNDNLIITENLNVEILGMKDLVVVQKGNHLLILPKSESQGVKGIYEKIEKENTNFLY